MTLESGLAGAMQPPTAPRLQAQDVLGGRYTITELIRHAELADVYRATSPDGTDVFVHLVHASLVASPPLREALANGLQAATALSTDLPDAIRHAAVPMDVGTAGEHCYFVTPVIDGQTVRELIARKAHTGGAGFGARGTASIIGAVCQVLRTAHEQGLCHGALTPDMIYVSAAGQVSVIGFGLGQVVSLAMQSGAAGASPHIAPELATAGHISPAADVYSAGMLLYEVLAGRRLQKGGPRPSDCAPEVNPVLDQLVALSVSAQPDKRPESIEAFEQALASGIDLSAPARAPQPTGQGPSLAQSIAPSPSQAMAAFDPSLLASTEEKWLIGKGRLDYGPFTMAEVIDQIRANQIVSGNIIIDNHSGERWLVQEHPLLGDLVEEARQLRDDSRRAEAEVFHAKQEKRRGVALYGVIAGGVLVLGLVAYLLVTRSGEDKTEVAQGGVTTVGEGEFTAKITFPKKDKKTRRRSSSRSRSRSSSSDDTLSLDLSDEGGGSERLDDSVINDVIGKNGAALGRCLHKNGGGYAHINFIIKGPTGKVNWVKVNGQQAGGLYSCINKAMRRMQFPTVNGPRTRAEFDMEL